MNNSNVTVYTSYPVNQIIKKKKKPGIEKKGRKRGRRGCNGKMYGRIKKELKSFDQVKSRMKP